MKNITVSRAARAGEQLLRTPAPQPDESLMGYILRLAESNYYEAPKWILDLAGLKMDNLRNGWRKLCDDRVDFTLFKQITRLSEEEVNEMKHEIISDSDYEQCDAQWDVPINSLRFNRPMVCSDCLRENPYCRKFWDLPVVRVCPQHHSLLLNMCPDCREPITWNRKSVSRCRCGCDWREIRSPELPPAQRQAMRLLMRSCGVSESDRAGAEQVVSRIVVVGRVAHEGGEKQFRIEFEGAVESLHAIDAVVLLGLNGEDEDREIKGRRGGG